MSYLISLSPMNIAHAKGRVYQGRNLWLRLNDSGHAHSAHYTIIAHSTMHPDGDGPLGVLEPVGGGAPNVRQPLLWKYQYNTVGEPD